MDTGSVNNMPVSMLWHSPTEVVALEGEKARFKCIIAGQWVSFIYHFSRTEILVILLGFFECVVYFKEQQQC